MGMERSDSLIKFISILVFLALLVYIGVSVFTSYTDPLRTTITSSMTLLNSVPVTGYIVREEEILSASGSNIAVTASEGAKLAAGETYAMQYVGSAAMERAQEINDVRAKIEQLTAIRNGLSSTELSRSALLSLAQVVASGDLDRLYDVERDVDAYILSGDLTSTGTETQEIALLEEELSRLIAASASDTVRLTVPSSGTFSHVADGFEGVSPAELTDLTAEKVAELFAAPKSVNANTYGKLVHGIRWYFVTTMDESSATMLKKGGTALLRFSKTYSAELSMRVESVGFAENGVCAVVFSCDKYMQDVAALREVTAEIVFDEQSGVGVPREAVHLNEDGETFVYVLRGLRATAVTIEILDESGDYYMAAEDREGLRSGDIVIVRANNLYDGAVVER